MVTQTSMSVPTFAKLHADAVKYGHPDPERMAATSYKNYLRNIELKEQRSKVVFIAEPPKVNLEGLRKATNVKCNARTFGGNPCQFKASCGMFCKRHAGLLQKK